MTEVASNLGSGQAEEPSDFGKGEVGEWSYWMTQEKIADKEERQWVKRSERIIKRYRDERPDTAYTGRDSKKMNMLWSNVQTLLPVLYARTPKANVERRFKDEDDVGRLASELLQRSLDYFLEVNDFDEVMKAAVSDRLLPGRGVARVLYEPKFGDEIPAGDDELEPGEAGDPESATVASEGDATQQDDRQGASPDQDKLREVDFEGLRWSYIFWKDYREGPARVWAEVPWVRYRSYLTREEMRKRFGKKLADKVSLDYSPKGDAREGTQPDSVPDAYKKAVIHEYWDKRALDVVWLAPGTPDIILDKADDPLKLNGFFPSAPPLLGTTTTDKRIPVPDYIEYQDQALLIDELTQRINKLLRALRAKGIYAADEKDALQRLFDVEDDAILIPVENWAHLQAKGGLDKAITWVPIENIASVLIQLYEARDKEVQVMYQITGISDILRGETSDIETARAQTLKSSFATRRISPKQKDVAKFARDLIRLGADVIGTHFSAKTISMITGYPQLLPVPQLPPMPAQQLQLAAPSSPPVAAGAPPAGAAPPAQPGSGAQVIPHPAMMGGQPPQPQQPPQPSPEMQAWMKQAQQVQQIVAQNKQRQQQFDAAVALLKQDAQHDFRIDIEADSTIAPDEMAEKAARTEYLQQMIPLLEQVIPIAQGNPALADLSKEIVLFATRAFPAARSLEETLEKAFDQLKGMPPNPDLGGKGKGHGTDPHVEMAKVQATAQTAMAKTQASSQADAQATAQKAAAANQANAIKAQQVQGQLALQAQQVESEAQFRQQKISIDQAKLQSQEQLHMMEAVHLAATKGRDLE